MDRKDDEQDWKTDYYSTARDLVVSQQTLDPLAIVDAAQGIADSTRAKYRSALESYQESGGDMGNVEHLRAYAGTLGNSGRAMLKAAFKLVTDTLVLQFKANATPETAGAIQAMQYRVESMQAAIKVEASKGDKVHTWLSAGEVRQLVALCDLATQTGRRDRVALGLLVAAGLRRAEAASLTFEAIKLQPSGDRMRAVLEVVGKGSKKRAVPISDKLATALDEWGAEVGGKGRILRSINNKGEVGTSLSEVGVFNIVRSYGEQIGKVDLAPHDLRRTYAQLGYSSGVPVTQISRLLGHASITTTQRYLNMEIDLTSTASDFVPF